MTDFPHEPSAHYGFFSCSGCQMPFERSSFNESISLGCACESEKRRARANYASSFDMSRLVAPTSAPDGPVGPLCDACVFSALLEGRLIQIGERYDYFESGGAELSGGEQESAVRALDQRLEAHLRDMLRERDLG